MSLASISIVIPTYRREQVLIDTIEALLSLPNKAAELIIVDQTPQHENTTERLLANMQRGAKIKWIRLERPSITAAMNVGLKAAKSDVVLFLDDDVIPNPDLIAAHLRAHAQADSNIIAGQVLQPGESPLEKTTSRFEFRSSVRQHISELMGGNFSIKRELALRLGGFDENFVHVAYRFEAEFASRALVAGEKILFEPAASIRHLKVKTGGTRSFGEHLTTIRPSHSVGAYYYLFRAASVKKRLYQCLSRPFRSISTRHHLLHPWWIPPTLVAEALGFLWATVLRIRGPRLLGGR